MTVLRVYTSFQLVLWGCAKKNSLWALDFCLFFHNDLRLFFLLTLGLKRPVPLAGWALWGWQPHPQPGMNPGSATYQGRVWLSWCLHCFMYQTGRTQAYGNRIEINNITKRIRFWHAAWPLSRRPKQNIPMNNGKRDILKTAKPFWAAHRIVSSHQTCELQRVRPPVTKGKAIAQEVK